MNGTKKLTCLCKTDMRNVDGGTDTMRLLARVAHEQTQSAAADWDSIADAQNALVNSSFSIQTNVNGDGLSINRCEKLATSDRTCSQPVDNSELRSVDGGNDASSLDLPPVQLKNPFSFGSIAQYLVGQAGSAATQGASSGIA